MRAVVCREFGDFQNMRVEDTPPPELTPRGVRIGVRVAGMSYGGVLIVAGRYQRKPPLPFTPGSEVAGVVLEVAEGVTRMKPGDRVYANPDWGGEAEEVVAHEVNVHPMPYDMSFDEGVQMPNSYATAAACLTWTAELQAGETVLVHAAAGGVGIPAVEMAKAMGATVIACASSAEKLAHAAAHGADHGIDYSAGGFRDQVKALTDGRGADVIIDSVGGDVTLESLRCIAREGRIITIGYASGTIPEVPINYLMLKSASIRGLNYGTYFGWSPGDGRETHAPRVFALHERMMEWYRAGALKPEVGPRYRLEDFRDAMAAIMERRAVGKVVLDLGI